MSRTPSKSPQNNIFFKPVGNFGSANQVDILFQHGLTLLSQGGLEQARGFLEKVIKINPQHFDSFHLLGIIAAQLKDFEKAKELFDETIKLNPNNAAFFCNRGNALKELKQAEAAISNYDKAINLKKDYALAYLNKSIVVSDLRRFEDALNCVDRAIQIKSDYAEAYYQRGFNLIELKRLDEALTSYERAIELKSDYAEAYLGRATVLQELNRLEEALTSYERAIELKSDYAEAYLGRGIVFNELKRLDEALMSFERAIELKSDYAEAYSNRGNVLKELKRLDEALTSYERAIELKSDYAEAFYNRGIVFNELKRLDEALTSYERAIELKSDYAEAYLNKSLLLLSLQDFENGWQLYDWRWDDKKFDSTYLSSNKPKLINIESAYNKKLLIWAEQGIGDQILYSSMLDQLLSIAPSSQIILDKRLLPLFRRSFAHGNFLDRISGTQDIEYDEHLPIGDLGKFFRTSSADFDLSRNNYLLADALRAKEIRADLINNKKFLCGITWNSKREKTGAEKSIELDELLPILTNKKIAFVSLQYGDVQNQLTDFNEKHNLNIKEYKSVDNFHDIDGHAALIEACDFVVTISNSSAHISGAIGKETFLMCPVGKGSIWYWSNQLNEKNLWYPSIHIFEQNLDGNWVDVVQRIKLVIENKINVN